MSRTGRGLPMTAKWNPEELREEEVFLQQLEEKPLWTRIGGYFRLTGPAWLQSAMTLGAGSAAASVMAGVSLDKLQQMTGSNRVVRAMSSPAARFQ